MTDKNITLSDADIQWHHAFCAAAELELSANRTDLDFQREYNLSQKPLRAPFYSPACNCQIVCPFCDTVVTVHSPIEFEVISGHFVRKSRGLRREMLQMQHFCASRSVVTFTTCKGVNSNIQSIFTPKIQ